MCAHWPVSRQARLPEQVGAAQNASRKSTPWSESRWMFGVGTWWPYGWMYLPVSWECRYRMFGRSVTPPILTNPDRNGSETSPLARPNEGAVVRIAAA